YQLQRSPVDCSRRSMRQLGDQSQAGAALNQGQEAVALDDRAHDGIALPVAHFVASLDGFGSGVDHRLALQAAAFLWAESAFSAALAALAQAAAERATALGVAAHVAVDGHVADPGHVVVGQPVRDLLGAPLLASQKVLDGL